MRKYRVLYIIGKFQGQVLTLTTPYYHKINEMRWGTDGKYRVLEDVTLVYVQKV